MLLYTCSLLRLKVSSSLNACAVSIFFIYICTNLYYQYPLSIQTSKSMYRHISLYICIKDVSVFLCPHPQVITANVVDFKAPSVYDRVVSIEMFEHMKNYAVLMERIAQWLKPGGKLFVHIFVHKTMPYHFEVGGYTRSRGCTRLCVHMVGRRRKK